MFQSNFVCRLNKEILSSLLCAHLLWPLLSVFNAKACPKMSETFSSRHKAKFYVIEEENLISNIEIYHIAALFSPGGKKNFISQRLITQSHQSFYSVISRISWKQISQHFSKLFWLVGTESCGAREELLLPQTTADKRQCLQGYQLHCMSRSSLESHSHCTRFKQCCYPYWSALHVQKNLPFSFQKVSSCCLQL